MFYTQTYLDTVGNSHNLQHGDTYTFRIKARNSIGDSIYSEEVSLMAATLPGAPGQPTRLTSTETTITIQWTVPTDNGGTPITDYLVMWDEGSGGSFVQAGQSLNQLEFTPAQELITGQSYRFKVRAVN